MIGFTLPNLPGVKLLPRSRRVGGPRRVRGHVGKATATPLHMKRDRNRRRNAIAAESRRRNRPRR